MMNRGILLLGESGSGKSSLALSLLHEGARFVADDLVELNGIRGAVRGKSPRKICGIMEVKGVGLIDISMAFGPSFIIDEATIDLIVRLDKTTADSDPHPPQLAMRIEHENILGYDIPTIVMGSRIDKNVFLCAVNYFIAGEWKQSRVNELIGSGE